MQSFEIKNTFPFQNVFHLIINVSRLRYRKHAAKRKKNRKDWRDSRATKICVEHTAILYGSCYQNYNCLITRCSHLRNTDKSANKFRGIFVCWETHRELVCVYSLYDAMNFANSSLSLSLWAAWNKCSG